MILPIYLYGQPVLRKVATDITKDYEGLEQLLKDMWQTLAESEGIGLAAPQIGLDRRIVVIDVDPVGETYPELKGVKMTLINPRLEVLPDGHKETREEGCLSLPGIHEGVTRIEKIHLTWVDENFEPHDEVIDGYLARVIQHEYDHLEGRMFIDHLSPIRKQLIKGKLNSILRGNVDCDYKTKGVASRRR